METTSREVQKERHRLAVAAQGKSLKLEGTFRRQAAQKRAHNKALTRLSLLSGLRSGKGWASLGLTTYSLYCSWQQPALGDVVLTLFSEGGGHAYLSEEDRKQEPQTGPSPL